MHALHEISLALTIEAPGHCASFALNNTPLLRQRCRHPALFGKPHSAVKPTLEIATQNSEIVIASQ